MINSLTNYKSVMRALSSLHSPLHSSTSVQTDPPQAHYPGEISSSASSTLITTSSLHKLDTLTGPLLGHTQQKGHTTDPSQAHYSTQDYNRSTSLLRSNTAYYRSLSDKVVFIYNCGSYNRSLSDTLQQVHNSAQHTTRYQVRQVPTSSSALVFNLMRHNRAVTQLGCNYSRSLICTSYGPHLKLHSRYSAQTNYNRSLLNTADYNRSICTNYNSTL